MKIHILFDDLFYQLNKTDVMRVYVSHLILTNCARWLDWSSFKIPYNFLHILHIVCIKRTPGGFQTFFQATQISASKSYATQSQNIKKKKKGWACRASLSSPKFEVILDTCGAGLQSALLWLLQQHVFLILRRILIQNGMLRHLVRLWLKNGFVVVSLYNLLSLGCFFSLFIFNLSGSRKGPRPKLKALAWRPIVWKPLMYTDHKIAPVSLG